MIRARRAAVRLRGAGQAGRRGRRPRRSRGQASRSAPHPTRPAREVAPMTGPPPDRAAAWRASAPGSASAAGLDPGAAEIAIRPPEPAAHRPLVRAAGGISRLADDARDQLPAAPGRGARPRSASAPSPSCWPTRSTSSGWPRTGTARAGGLASCDRPRSTSSSTRRSRRERRSSCALERSRHSAIPEFFVPAHHLPRPLPEGRLITPDRRIPALAAAAAAFITAIVQHYRGRQRSSRWQVEHEPVDPLGMEHSWRLSARSCSGRSHAVRAADPARPVIAHRIPADLDVRSACSSAGGPETRATRWPSPGPARRHRRGSTTTRGTRWSGSARSPATWPGVKTSVAAAGPARACAPGSPAPAAG